MGADRRAVWTALSNSPSAMGTREGWEASAGLCALHPGLGREGRGQQVCGQLPRGAQGAAGWREHLPSLSQCWGG